MTLAPPLRSRPRTGAVALVLAWLLLLGVLAAAAGYVLMVPGQMAHEQTVPEQSAPGAIEPAEPVMAEAGTAEQIPEPPEPTAVPEPEAASEPVPDIPEQTLRDFSRKYIARTDAA